MSSASGRRRGSQRAPAPRAAVSGTGTSGRRSSFGSAADQRRDELLAQPRHEPLEAVRAHGAEQLQRHVTVTPSSSAPGSNR